MRDATLNDLTLEAWFRARVTRQIVWTTKDGVKIPINEMSDEHLINTIKMLKRNKEHEEQERIELEEAMSSAPSDLFY